MYSQLEFVLIIIQVGADTAAISTMKPVIRWSMRAMPFVLIPVTGKFGAVSYFSV